MLPCLSVISRMKNRTLSTAGPNHTGADVVNSTQPGVAMGLLHHPLRMRECCCSNHEDRITHGHWPATIAFHEASS